MIHLPKAIVSNVITGNPYAKQLEHCNEQGLRQVADTLLTIYRTFSELSNIDHKALRKEPDKQERKDMKATIDYYDRVRENCKKAITKAYSRIPV